MGTRFLAAPETRVPQIYRNAIFKTSAGGQATARSRVFDEIWGPNFWPPTTGGVFGIRFTIDMSQARILTRFDVGYPRQ